MKPFATYGKKPRGSKTSKRETINGIPVFLHYSNASTGSSIICYHDVKPYPRIVVAAGEKYWTCRDKLYKFFDDNLLDIRHALDTLDSNFGVPKEYMDKIILDSSKYKIYDKNPKTHGYSLVVHKHLDDYVYLFANPDEAPTKNIRGKKVLDGDKIYVEYVSRSNAELPT